jgi:phage protein U
MILKDENQINTLFVFDDSQKAITNLETKDKLVWIEHQIPNKKGSIRHFMGNDDGDIVLTGLFLGDHSTKVSNKATLRGLALNGTILFLDSEGYEDDIDGKYVITEIEIPERGGEPWEFTLVLSEFNN